jgi:mannose-1-phosphate guanylyltransferase
VKALILAGGLGTRLRPLTYTRPKHLLPIANRPHIEHVFHMLETSGVHEVVLLTSYLADAFSDVVERAARRGLHVQVAHESEPLGTAGALKNAEMLVADDTFLAFNGDILSDVDLNIVIGFHRDRRAEATVLLTPVDDPSAFGVVPTDPDGRVLGFIEKPPRDEAPTNLINAGVYVMEPTVFGRIPTGRVSSAERELFPGMVSDGARLFAVSTDAYWMDIGTPEKYLRANLDALSGRFHTDAVPQPGDGVVLMEQGATISPGARVSAACIGADAMVLDRAVVKDSVLLPGAIVEPGAHVTTTVLGERARVTADVTVAGAAVADGQTIS